MSNGRSAASGVVWWRAVAVVLFVLAAVSLVIWSDRAPGPSAAPARAVAGVTGTTTATPAPEGSGTRETGVSEPEALRPVRLMIPDLQLDTRLVTLGVHPDRTVEVPSDPDRAGWFRLGTTPGAIGSSVILGHRDSVDGPAVFAGLSTLTAGARVAVRMDDGSVATFEVRSVHTYANEAFPARKVYGSHGRSELNLVTCGGVYDASRGGWQSNVVVNARLV